VTQRPKNVVASVLAKLRNVAESSNLSFNDILQSYVIERFLALLARSKELRRYCSKAHSCFPSGVLRRGPRNRPISCNWSNGAAIEDPSDGVVFEPTTISVEPIRDSTEYVGTRIRPKNPITHLRWSVKRYNEKPG
jgi:hypothetical protein